jgi:hypothetical protein
LRRRRDDRCLASFNDLNPVLAKIADREPDLRLAA